MKPFRTFFFCLCASVYMLGSTTSFAAEEEIKISELQKVDEIYLSHKRELASDLSFKELQKIVHGDKRDLSVIQSLLDQELVGPADEQELFALGVLLGDVYVSEYQLEWKNYEDEIGKSRAVCLPRTQQCLFPITMISKRVKRGFKVDVNDVYQHSISLLQDYFPKLPYSAK